MERAFCIYMANNQMKLELLLKGNDQLSTILKKSIALLKSFRGAADDLDKSLSKLTKQRSFSFSKSFVSEVRKSSAEANKLKKTLESLNSVKIKSPKTGVPRDAAYDLAESKANPEKGEKELDKIYGKKHKPKGVVNRLAEFNDNVIQPAGQIKNVWKDNIDSLREYTDETKKLYLAQAKFKLINLSPEENKKAFDAVDEVVRKFGTVTRTEGIETLTDLHTALGSLPHAIEALPAAAKYRFSMETLYGDKLGSDQIEHQIQSMVRFLELTGKTTKGAEEMNKAFNVMTQISSATGGRVTPDDFFAMGQTGKTSVQNLTPEGMRNLSAIIQSFGSGATGTALMSLSQSLVGGVMKQPSAEEFARLGLVDKSKIEYNNAGRIKHLLPGANKLGDLMMTDPLSAADILRDAMQKHGIKTEDPKEIDKELYLLFQNRNANALMSFLINKRSQVTKESGLAQNAQGNDKMYEAMDKQLKDLKKYENALTDFKTQAGIPLIQMFGKLAESATPILKFFAEHENITKWTLYALGAWKVLKGISETASILKTAKIGSIFSDMTSETGAATTKVAGFTKELSNATTKTSAFQKVASSPIAVNLAITGALLAIGTLKEQFDELDEREQKVAEAVKTIAQGHDNLLGRGLLYNAPGDYKDKAGNDRKSDFDEQATRIFDAMKEGRTLETSLHPERATWWEYYKNLSELPYGSSDNYGQFNPQVAAHRWQVEGFSSSLQDPNVLARFVSKIQRGGDDNTRLNLADIGLMMKTLEQVTSKDKMATALDILKKESNGDKPTNQAFSLPQYLKQLNQPTSPFSQIPNLYHPESPLKFQVGNAFGKLSENLFSFNKPPAFQTAPLGQPFANLRSPNSSQPPKPLTQIFGELKQPTTILNQNLTQLSGQAAPLGQSFVNLQKPANESVGSFSSLSINSNTASTAVGRLADSTNQAASLISNLKIDPPSFGDSKPVPSPGENKNFSRLFGGGRAKGGSVTAGKPYFVGEIGKELFIPETNGSIAPNDFLRSEQKRREQDSFSLYKANIFSPEISGKVGANPPLHLEQKSIASFINSKSFVDYNLLPQYPLNRNTTKTIYSGNTPGRAKGGSVTAGKPYLVGEIGKELFIPETSGKIIPNDHLRSQQKTFFNSNAGLSLKTINSSKNFAYNQNNILGRAKGGSVTKGHTYRINEIGQEFFTPSVSGSVVSNNILRNARENNESNKFSHISEILKSNSFLETTTNSPDNVIATGVNKFNEIGQELTAPNSISIASKNLLQGGRKDSNSNVHINFRPVINLGSNSAGDVKDAVHTIRQELAGVVSELKERFSPRELARKVAYEAERDSERT